MTDANLTRTADRAALRARAVRAALESDRLADQLIPMDVCHPEYRALFRRFIGAEAQAARLAEDYLRSAPDA